MKILVIEDIKTNLMELVVTLNRFGHEVVPADDQENALTQFTHEHPDLVFVSIGKDGHMGYECVKKIREESSHWIPILFLSDSLDDESIAKGIQAGGDDYLLRPLSGVMLSSKLQALQRIIDMQQKLIEVNQKLSVLSATDILTGAYNRLQFAKVIKEKIAYAKRHKSRFALLSIDLDEFKIINDTLGHNMGDVLLKETAQRLNMCLRTEDFLARMGEDQFAVIIESVDDLAAIGSLANRIISHISMPLNVMGKAMQVSVSIGIAFYPKDGEGEEILLQNSEKAMQDAKQNGNSYNYYASSQIKKPLHPGLV